MSTDEFFEAYVAAALWTATDLHGNPLDATFDTTAFSEEAWRSMRADCNDFVREHGEVISTLDYAERGEQWSNWALAGHDFLLTRQHHGAGFWDRGLGDLGDLLTDAAHAFGDTHIYVSDNNELEVM